MRERDDLELFIHQLEAALVASEIPRHKWKRYIHSQLTLESKQCGKPSHMSRDCRARLSGDSSPKQTTAVATPAVTPQVDKKPVVCFSCHQVGHKSPQCPKQQQGSVNRIKIPVDCVKALGNNEVMAEMSGILLPVTLDSGAQVTIVPEEAVKESEFTGETTRFSGIMHGEYSGKLANIVLQIGGETFARTAVAVPGKDISWTAAMSFNMKDMEEFKRLHHQLNLSSQLPEEDTHLVFCQRVLVSVNRILNTCLNVNITCSEV